MTRSIRLVLQVAAMIGVSGTPAACQSRAGQVPEAGAGLRRVTGITLPGPPARFDYQSVDTVAGRLWVAHMNAGTLLVFDVKSRQVVTDLPGFPSVHGVIAVPALGKAFATATGEHRVVVVDASTLKPTARLGPIGYPDGLAWAPEAGRVFVSDESSAGRELVIDALADSVIGSIELGGEAGNTILDPVSGRILVAVQTRAEIVAIDPATIEIVGRYPVPGSRRPHGMVIDPVRRLLFVADEAKAELFVLELPSMRVLASQATGDDPDVLAVDSGLGRLYVACESGGVDVFRVDGTDLVRVGRLAIPHAHTVAVDPATHLVYLPIERIGGRPVMEIYTPTDAEGTRQ